MPGFERPNFPESFLPKESQPWRRFIEDLIVNNSRGSDRAQTNDLASSKTQNSTIRSLSAQILAMPVPVSKYKLEKGFGITGGAYYIDVPITVPTGKTKVVVTAIANVFARGNPGGTGTLECYLEANGSLLVWSSPVLLASKSITLGGIGNSVTGALGFEQDPVSSFTVSLSIYPTVPSEFPANGNNFASVTVNCIFFD